MIQSERGGTDESQYSLHFPPSPVSAGFRAQITKLLPQTSPCSCQVLFSYRVLDNISSTLRIRFLWATSNRKLNHMAWTTKMFVLLLNPSPEVNSAKDNSMAQTYHPRLALLVFLLHPIWLLGFHPYECFLVVMKWLSLLQPLPLHIQHQRRKQGDG